PGRGDEQAEARAPETLWEGNGAALHPGHDLHPDPSQIARAGGDSLSWIRRAGAPGRTRTASPRWGASRGTAPSPWPAPGAGSTPVRGRCPRRGSDPPWRCAGTDETGSPAPRG